MAFSTTANARERDYLVLRGEIEDYVQQAASGAENVSAVTATDDGLTTGLIPAGARFVSITSANAAHWVTLPTGVLGHRMELWIGGTACEIRTPAASGTKINDVDSDGTAQFALPINTLLHATFVGNTTGGWIVQANTKLGAVLTAIVPDAP